MLPNPEATVNTEIKADHEILMKFASFFGAKVDHIFHCFPPPSPKVQAWPRISRTNLWVPSLKDRNIPHFEFCCGKMVDTQHKLA